MVKFGVHADAFLKDNQGNNLYVVPYRQVRDDFIESSSGTAHVSFESEWITCLGKARTDFDEAMCGLWERVFQGIASSGEARGAPPEKAFGMYFFHAGVEASQELLVSINSIYETALTNAEALRKLVKKYDKQHQQNLSPVLLPRLYASNFIVGQPTLEDGLGVLRHALGLLNEDDIDDDDAASVESLPQQRNAERRGRQHDATVQRRKEELAWLRKLVESFQKDEIPCIVAHRGFHNPRGFSDRRPLENSLQAYEAAWTNGIHLCECDIALTLDEKLVLAHDEDFSRLALDKDSPMYRKQVRDLTFRELISLPLKSGIRPPLLIDVLRSARAIGGDSQLIIEIKPGNNESAQALARMFIRHPDLMEQCAVIMSFDLYAMHSLRNDLAVLKGADAGLRPGHRSKMSLRDVPLLVDPSDIAAAGDIGGFMPLGSHRDSFDHFGVGLTLSSTRLSHLDLVTDKALPVEAVPRPPVVPPATPTAPSPLQKPTTPPKAKPPDIELPKQQSSPTEEASKRKLPKLLLLTVNDEPKIPCELQVGVEEMSKVEGWLERDDGALDGVYMQFQKEMLEPEGSAALRALSTKYALGVWGYAHKDPDDYKTFHHLVKKGNVSYVNSDLPKGFRKKGGIMGGLFGSSKPSS